MSVASARERVAALDWYHTIDLEPGLTTPGWFDTRPTAEKVGMPASLAGRRCVDVGTWDGFWAFEMERRGAAAVTAVDILDEHRWDWPPEMSAEEVDGEVAVLRSVKRQGEAFTVAHEVLGSQVERVDVNVYDLSPETVGTFDFAFLGTVLMHLRDPVGALAALRSVLTGEAIISDAIDLVPTLLRPRTPSFRLEGRGRPWWWIPNRAGFHQMVRSAGFEILEERPIYHLPVGPRHPRPSLRKLPTQVWTAQGRESAIATVKGIPHAAVRVRPV